MTSSMGNQTQSFQIMNKKIWKAIALATIIVWTGCQKEQPQRSLSDEVKTESYMEMAERAIQDPVDALTLRGGGGADCGEGGMPWPDCVVITDSGEDVYPRTITVDFGDDCYTPNGLQRSGTIEIVLTGDVRNEVGASRTVTVDLSLGEFMVMSGVRVLTNDGQNEAGDWVFSQSSDMDLQRGNLTVVRSYEGTRTWLSGHDTPACADDIWQRDGNGSKTVTNAAGQSGTVTIAYDAVVYDRPCGYPVSGSVTLQRNAFTRILDYGDGSCDSIAELTINGETYLFDLETHEIIE